MNAFATAGHIVAVTRTAMSLPPNLLAGVLAHELGHHLSGRAWASLLTYWYSLPGRLAARLFFWINFVLLAVVGVVASIFDRTGPIGALFGFMLRVFPYVWPVLVGLALFAAFPPLVLLVVAPLVLAWVSRLGEKRADAAAAAAGYGQPMLEVLYGWLQAGHDEARREQGVKARLYASHPTCADRIRALETLLYGQSAA